MYSERGFFAEPNQHGVTPPFHGFMRLPCFVVVYNVIFLWAFFCFITYSMVIKRYLLIWQLTIMKSQDKLCLLCCFVPIFVKSRLSVVIAPNLKKSLGIVSDPGVQFPNWRIMHYLQRGKCKLYCCKYKLPLFSASIDITTNCRSIDRMNIAKEYFGQDGEESYAFAAQMQSCEWDVCVGMV